LHLAALRTVKSSHHRLIFATSLLARLTLNLQHRWPVDVAWLIGVTWLLSVARPVRVVVLVHDLGAVVSGARGLRDAVASISHAGTNERSTMAANTAMSALSPSLHSLPYLLSAADSHFHKLCLDINVSSAACALPVACHGTPHSACRRADPFPSPPSGPLPRPPG
jgi:hypothetical protein